MIGPLRPRPGPLSQGPGHLSPGQGHKSLASRRLEAKAWPRGLLHCLQSICNTKVKGKGKCLYNFILRSFL